MVLRGPVQTTYRRPLSVAREWTDLTHIFQRCAWQPDENMGCLATGGRETGNADLWSRTGFMILPVYSGLTAVQQSDYLAIATSHE